MILEGDYEPKFSGFHDLMKFRVREILLVSSPYDAFVLEEDGRLAERVFGEFLDLNLQFVPRIHRVSSVEEAFAELHRRTYDLVITMTRLADMDPLQFGKRIKELYPGMPVILLTYEALSSEYLRRIREEQSIDKVFFWSGNTKLLLAIIKYIEDRENVGEDARQGVQIILIIEDSPWYYSQFLPFLYTEIMKQTRYLISHGVNTLHRLLRMRARPKILMAETFEETIEIFNRYKRQMLALITDLRFQKEGTLNPESGLEIINRIKGEIPDIPCLIQTGEWQDGSLAHQRGASFISKHSPDLFPELHRFILNHCGFGDFVFRHPSGEEISRASNLSEFEKQLQSIPDESLLYHAEKNHFSRWLLARTEFKLAEEIRDKKTSDYPGPAEIRADILNCIRKLFDQIQHGVITEFGLSKIDVDNAFVKLGGGSIGGKGRGIAFINATLSKTGLLEKYPEIQIGTPRTVILGSDLFEEFLEKNPKLSNALKSDDEEFIAGQFLKASLPPELETNLARFLDTINYPLAVRSSSILEDSQTLPFAGLYRTYMLSNSHRDKAVRLRQLTEAVKLVYASVFYRSPREYIKNADLRIEDEKMAVLIQEVVGETHGNHYYPVVSGVAQSYNFYPLARMSPEEGVVSLAMGMGRAIMEGKRVFRFSPALPEMNPPFSTPEEYLKKTQNGFYSLDLSESDCTVDADEGTAYHWLDLPAAESHGTLYFTASTYSAADQSIRDGISICGPRINTFAPILKQRLFPLADMISDFLRYGREAFGAQVEIEFALNLHTNPRKKQEFYFLQIRPMVMGREQIEVETPELPDGSLICKSAQALGNGVFREISDLVFVDPDRFHPGETRKITGEIAGINEAMSRENRSYILIGFGRFGTSDPWLGIPVEWHQISRARVLVECTLPGFHIDPSQGSHFFHNLISLRMGYMYIPDGTDGNRVNWQWLKEQPRVHEGEHVRHIRLETPMLVKIDGRESKGFILKPGEA